MSLLTKLTGGDFRSIGNSEQVAADVLVNPSLFPELFAGLSDADALIRMRAADATEKVTAARPDLLQSFKPRLLKEIAAINQQEVRWHVAQMIPRLTLTPTERSRAVIILKNYLSDKSSIVKTFSMQALADLAQQNEELKPEIYSLIKMLTRTGTPAMKTRGRKLLKILQPKLNL
jgi:hypothetical protein